MPQSGYILPLCAAQKSAVLDQRAEAVAGRHALLRNWAVEP